MRAADLSAEHHGWLVKIPVTQPHDAAFPGPTHRTITLGGVRRWTYDGVQRVGLLDLDQSGPWRGTEYGLIAESPVELVRQIKRGVPRARKNDYATEAPDA